VALPVTVTVNVAVEVAVPLKPMVIPIFFADGVVPVNAGTVLLSVTANDPVPEFRTVLVDKLTVPANPAAVIAVLVPDGRLPIWNVPLAEPPELKVDGLPVTTVRLKSCGRARIVTA
jgi:hypothetical protein